MTDSIKQNPGVRSGRINKHEQLARSRARVAGVQLEVLNSMIKLTAPNGFVFDRRSEVERKKMIRDRVVVTTDSWRYADCLIRDMRMTTHPPNIHSLERNYQIRQTASWDWFVEKEKAAGRYKEPDAAPGTLPAIAPPSIPEWLLKP